VQTYPLKQNYFLLDYRRAGFLLSQFWPWRPVHLSKKPMITCVTVKNSNIKDSSSIHMLEIAIAYDPYQWNNYDDISIAECEEQIERQPHYY